MPSTSSLQRVWAPKASPEVRTWTWFSVPKVPQGVETFQVLFFQLLSQCHGLPYAKRCRMSPAEVQCCDFFSGPRSSCLSMLGGRLLCCSAVPVLSKEAVVIPCMKNIGCSSFCGKGWRRSRLLQKAPIQGVRHDWEEKNWLQLDNDFIWSGNTHD